MVVVLDLCKQYTKLNIGCTKFYVKMLQCHTTTYTYHAIECLQKAVFFYISIPNFHHECSLLNIPAGPTLEGAVRSAPSKLFRDLLSYGGQFRRVYNSFYY